MVRRTALALATLIPLLFLSTGCLVKEKHDTFCLDPDGSVKWSSVERNIHAVADTPADRLREETEFMALVARDEHQAATEFRELGGTDVRTQVLSADWPFSISTEARFDNIATLWQRVFDQLGTHASSTLKREGNRTTWTLEVDSEQTTTSSDDKQSTWTWDDDGDFAPVVMIRHGEFVDSTGFTVSDDGRVAKLDTEALKKQDFDKQPKVVLSLSWVNVEAIKPPVVR